MVSIARALSHDVRLLIMDEPSAILDEGEIETLFEVVRRLTTEGVGVVYITHRLDEIRRIGDRVTVLTDGRTAATGIPSTTPTDELVELMVGRKVERLYPDRPAGSERVLLEVRGLRRLPMVRGVSLEVRAGEVLGLGGLVGSGRSELLRLIYGIDAPEEGEVLIEGERLAPNRPDRAIAAGLGLAPEDRKSQGLLLEWSMTKNVSLADLGRFIRPLLNVRAERAAAAEQLRELNTVPDDPDRIVRELSGGNQQKVVLARWLLRHCRVLLLDEPTRGVDVPTKAELYRVIADLAASGLGVVMVSSELEELAGLCTRVLVMREGELVAEVAGEDASERELLRHAVAPTETTDFVEEVSEQRSRQMTAAAARRFGALELQEYALAIVVVLLFVVGAILKPDSFPTWDNVRNMLTQASVVGVIAIGMTFVIATGGIDLSVGSVLAAAGRLRRGARRPRRHDLDVHPWRGRLRHPARARSTRPRSPSAAWSRSSPRWRCSRSERGWRSCSTTNSQSGCSTSTGARSATRPRSRCCGSAPARSWGSRSRSTSSSGSRSAAGSCSTGRATGATWSPSAAIARPRGSPACRSAG